MDSTVHKDAEELMDLTEDLLTLCPLFRIAQTFKVKLLCKMQRWEEAKNFAEQSVCGVHPSIQVLSAHPTGCVYPAPAARALVWLEKTTVDIKTGASCSVDVNTPAVAQACLFMGEHMSRHYVLALKNLDISRNCSADVMDKLARCTDVALLHIVVVLLLCYCALILCYCLLPLSC